MMRRTPLKRTGWNRKPCSQARQVRDDVELDLVVVSEPPRLLRRGVYAPVSQAPAAAVVKDEPLRSEPYRRLVASLPCIHCGKAGRSQHAHENEGKGARLKLDDRRAMPLCADEPGREGCHTRFDQYRLVPGGREAHIELGRTWSQQTRQEIERRGLWPASVPRLPA